MSKLAFKNPIQHIKHAQALRKEAPMVERLLWNALSEMRKETKLKFRRQHPIHPYIADFACIKAKLIVELDGASHDARQAYDKKRDADLQSHGWSILRFTNEDVETNLEGVVLSIVERAQAQLALP